MDQKKSNDDGVQRQEQQQKQQQPRRRRSVQEEWQHTLTTRIPRAIKVGLLVRLGLGILRIVVLKGKIFTRELLSELWGEMISWNPLKWASLFAGMSTYHAHRVTLEGLFDMLGSSSSSSSPMIGGVQQHVAALVAGILAALPGFVFQLDTRINLAFYLAVRVLHAFATIARDYSLTDAPSSSESPASRPVLRPVDVLLSPQVVEPVVFGIVNGMLVYASAYYPDTHFSPYQMFLVKSYGYDGRLVSGFANLQRGILQPSLLDYCRKHRLSSELMTMASGGATSTNRPPLFCRLAHPETSSCLYSHLQFLPRSFRQDTLPMYLPLKILATIVSVATSTQAQRVKVLQHPVKTMTNIVRSSAQSAIFVSLLSAVSRAGFCAISRIWSVNDAAAARTQVSTTTTKSSARGFAFIAFLSSIMGPLLLIEEKGRRLELVLFCAMHALRAFVNIGWMRGFYRRPKQMHADIFFVAAVAVLLYLYDKRPKSVHRNIAGGLSKIVP